MSNFFKPKYKAAIYLRISRDDGDKVESDSISNQREMIQYFVSRQDDIEIVAEMVDDGYSGCNFDRPGFVDLMKVVEDKKINCIIIKDFSRFSRDYVGSGMYILKEFPQRGIRVIAINDNYDSLNKLSTNDELAFFFKNALNDIYPRDTSIKIRSHLEVKRNNGEYIGPFVVYGYLKSKDDRHKIVVDKEVSGNIVNIFNWKIDGMSPLGIAERLNDYGVLSPAEYRKYYGSKHKGFKQTAIISGWSAQAVKRILTNPIYIGTLVQGKRTTANHKIKKVIIKEEKEWSVKENAHPAIISKQIFDTANEIMKRDTRNASRKTEANIFSGLLYCADCKDTMIRRVSKYKDSEYVYYRCSTQKNSRACTNHNIKEDVIYQLTLETLNAHIKAILGLKKTLEMLSESEINKDNLSKIDILLKEKENEISKRKKDIFFAHQNYADGILTQEEFIEFKSIYDTQIFEAQQSIERLRAEKEKFSKNSAENFVWMKSFTKMGEVKKLSHKMLVLLIDKIYVIDKQSIHIVFRYANEFNRLQNIIAATERNKDLMLSAG